MVPRLMKRLLLMRRLSLIAIQIVCSRSFDLKLFGNDHTIRFMFLTNLKYFCIFRLISVFETTDIIKTCKFTVFSSGSFCQIYRVTDEA